MATRTDAHLPSTYPPQLTLLHARRGRALSVGVSCLVLRLHSANAALRFRTTKIPAPDSNVVCCLLCAPRRYLHESAYSNYAAIRSISQPIRGKALRTSYPRLCTRTHTHTSLPRAGKPGRTCEWTRPQPRRPLLRAYEPIEYSEIPSARTSCALLGAQAKYGAPRRQRARPVALSVSRGAAPSASRASARAGRRGKARRLLIGLGRSLSVRSSSAECTPRSTRR